MTGNSSIHRIAILLPDLRPGGAERMRINMAKEWLSLGYLVDFVVLKEVGELLQSLPEGADLVNLDASRYRSALIPLIRYLKNSKPDILLAAMWPLTIVGIVAAAFSSHLLRVLVSDHNTLSNAYWHKGKLHRLFLRFSIRTVYPWADVRIAVSQGVAKDLSQLSGLSLEEFTVIYNPAYTDLGCFDNTVPQELEHNSKVVLSVGTLKEQKNHELLIEAFSKIASHIDLKLYILGEGALRERLQELVEKRELSGCVFLVGFRLNTEPWYRRADLFVLSSDYEGFGNVIVEALAQGTRVVSTDCPAGPREILCDGKFGKLVPVGDVEALAKAISDALLESPDREALKARAKDFSVEKIAGQYLDVMFSDHSERTSN